jgi:AcrR family transcriptional regulator
MTRASWLLAEMNRRSLYPFAGQLPEKRGGMSASGQQQSIVRPPAGDRRARRTRAALGHAFTKLLLSRGYDAISVADIASEADIGRSTFYEHYAGKEALLAESLAQPFAVLAGIASGQTTPAQLAALLDHFRTNRRLAGVLFATPIRPILSRCLAALIGVYLPHRAANGALVAPELRAQFLAEGQLALVEAWTMGRTTYSTERFAAALMCVTADGLGTASRVVAASAGGPA